MTGKMTQAEMRTRKKHADFLGVAAATATGYGRKDLAQSLTELSRQVVDGTVTFDPDRIIYGENE